MTLLSDLADTLRAVLMLVETGYPIEPILPDVKKVLERVARYTDEEKAAESTIMKSIHTYAEEQRKESEERVQRNLAAFAKVYDKDKGRADRAEKRVAELEAQLAEVSAELARLKGGG